MPVIVHQAEGDQLHLKPVLGLQQNADKCFAVTVFVEDDLTAISAIPRVVNLSWCDVPRRTTHREARPLMVNRCAVVRARRENGAWHRSGLRRGADGARHRRSL